MELRQLRYFVAIAEELHFGRAAKRQHVAQSALSQQLRLLENGLGVLLLDRDTHHVELTPAGHMLLANARQILADVERAASAVRHADRTTPILRAGFPCDHDCLRLVRDEVRQQHPELKVNLVEAGITEQYAWLIDGRLDIGFGPGSHAPSGITSALFRLDPLGVIVPAEHPFASMTGVPLRSLSGMPVAVPEKLRQLGLVQFVTELCQSADVAARLEPDGLERQPGITCAPRSSLPAPAGTVWRPLSDPRAAFPWSVLSLSHNASPHVRTVVACAHRAARQRGWLNGHLNDDRVWTGQV
jgi:DNA-binding transcriptional LysR family regulator